MNSITIMHEIAALAGYTIDASTGQDPTNKTRALRRLNQVKTDLVSRYGGKWPANYREGWIALVPLYTTGTVLFTQGSRTVTGTNTVWTSAFQGMKILGADNSYYKIASVTNGTTLILTQPYQGSTTLSTQTYQIWQDEYRLYPEVHNLAGFVDYQLTSTMREAWPRDMKTSFADPTFSELPNVYVVLQRQPLTTPYSTGTVSGTINTNTLTGSGTTWLSNIEPGYEITIGAYKYHVKSVESDTSLTLYQLLVVAPNGASYSAVGKNAIVVRFKEPSPQNIVHYWYWAKDYPAVNDNDEDWIMELFPEVIMNGAVLKDYLDKNDVARASLSRGAYEDSVKNMRVSVDGGYTGVRTVGYFVPPEARL